MDNVAWRPREELDERQWAHIGRRLSAINKASQWWVGDWLRYGMARWGEKYADASRITGYDVPSLRNMAWIASEFPLSRRRDDLTWSHHAAVAGLDQEEQDEWLTHAADRRLSVADLRLEVRSYQRRKADLGGEAAKDSEVEECAICPACGQRLPQATAPKRRAAA